MFLCLIFTSLLMCLKEGRIGKNCISGVFSVVGQEGRNSWIKSGKRRFLGKKRFLMIGLTFVECQLCVILGSILQRVFCLIPE